jgi:hypothetical protein
VNTFIYTVELIPQRRSKGRQEKKNQVKILLHEGFFGMQVPPGTVILPRATRILKNKMEITES